MKYNFNLDTFFSEKEIIRVLCRKRARLAKNIHDDHFLKNIAKSAAIPGSKRNAICSFFPSRKEWIRLNLQERNLRNQNSFERNILQLERTVWRYKRKNTDKSLPRPKWLEEIDCFVSNVRECVLNPSIDYKISNPKVYLISKGQDSKEYRAISSFSLKDQVTISQVAKYLTKCFDPLFLSCSYAFRARNDGLKKFSHHEAINDILEFKMKNKEDAIYVAECDIKKFYDCVNHRVIREKFYQLVREVESKLEVTVDERAIQIFESYLDCFSFYENIFKKEKQLLTSQKVKDGHIPWVSEAELIKVGSDWKRDRIGIPQGGALSCLVANIIMNEVDRIVYQGNDGDTFYARFCDDMVLLSANFEKCKSVFSIYQDGLRSLKLISHAPVAINSYDASFWSSKLKSKYPYRWGKRNKGKKASPVNVPWLSFVGYQIRYDGVVRVRKRSIEKEMNKQVSETGKLIRSVKKSNGARIRHRAIEFRLRQRLISMSVGRVKYGKKPADMCWTAGFKVIKNRETIDFHFKRLDRNRERQISRLRRHMRTFTQPDRDGADINVLRYHGSKFSYYEQYKRLRK